MSAPGRLDGLDGLKGLAILFVVMIHAAPPGVPVYADHVIGGLTRLAVPAFLAATGFLMGLRAGGRARARRSLRTFVRLHLLYGACYAVWNAGLFGLPDPVTAKFVVMRFAEAAWPGQYYFVVLIQLHAVLSLAPDGRWWASRAAALAATAMALAWLVVLVEAPGLLARAGLPGLDPALTTPSALPLWALFFAIGARSGRRYAGGDRGGLPERLALGAGLVLATLGWPAIPHWEPNVWYPYARIPILVGGALVAFGLPVVADLRPGRFVTRLGRDSFGVFVLNPAALSLAALVLGPIDSIASSWLHVACALALSVAATVALRRWAPWALP